jgi:hypothetical protein
MLPSLRDVGDASVATEREHALALLGAIKVALERAGPVRLTEVERDYLRDVCDRALVNDADPLRLNRSTGGQHDSSRLIAEAHEVHMLIKGGSTQRAACEAVGSQQSRDGSKSGAVEKNYRRHRPALMAAGRLYAARAADRAPDAADIKAILGAHSKGK